MHTNNNKRKRESLHVRRDGVGIAVGAPVIPNPGGGREGEQDPHSIRGQMGRRGRAGGAESSFTAEET